MRTSEYSLHDVEVIRIEQNRQGDSVWLTVTVQHKDGFTSELTFWPSNGRSVAIEIGAEE